MTTTAVRYASDFRSDGVLSWSVEPGEPSTSYPVGQTGLCGLSAEALLGIENTVLSIRKDSAAGEVHMSDGNLLIIALP